MGFEGERVDDSFEFSLFQQEYSWHDYAGSAVQITKSFPSRQPLTTQPVLPCLQPLARSLQLGQCHKSPLHGAHSARPAPVLALISAIMLLKMFKTHLQNKWQKEWSQRCRQRLHPARTQESHIPSYSFIFGSREMNLMENTGERGEAEGARWKRLLLRMRVCRWPSVLLRQDFSSSVLQEMTARFRNMKNPSSRFPSLIKVPSLPYLRSSSLTALWLLSTGLTIMKKQQSIHQQNIYSVNCGRSWNCHFLAVSSDGSQYTTAGGNDRESLRGTGLDSTRMCKSKQNFTEIKHIWQV